MQPAQQFIDLAFEFQVRRSRLGRDIFNIRSHVKIVTYPFFQDPKGL